MEMGRIIWNRGIETRRHTEPRRHTSRKAEPTPDIIGEAIRPHRAITMDNIDDIFAGRPIAENPRAKADVLHKAYLTVDMDEQVRAQAAKWRIGKSALIRKALVAYLAANQAQPAMIDGIRAYDATNDKGHRPCHEPRQGR